MARSFKTFSFKRCDEAGKMHESTVSRVTRSKLLQTPWGIFQMKDFSSSLGDTDQEAHAAKQLEIY